MAGRRRSTCTNAPASLRARLRPEPAPVPATARKALVKLTHRETVEASREETNRQHLDCAECAGRLAAKLRGQPGVYGASFDKRRAELSVIASPSFNAVAMMRPEGSTNEGPGAPRKARPVQK